MAEHFGADKKCVVNIDAVKFKLFFSSENGNKITLIVTNSFQSGCINIESSSWTFGEAICFIQQ